VPNTCPTLPLPLPPPPTSATSQGRVAGGSARHEACSQLCACLVDRLRDGFAYASGRGSRNAKSRAAAAS